MPEQENASSIVPVPVDPAGACPLPVATPPAAALSWTNNRLLTSLIVLSVTALVSSLSTLCIAYFTFHGRLQDVEYQIKLKDTELTAIRGHLGEVEKIRIDHAKLNAEFGVVLQKTTDHANEIDALRAKIASEEVGTGKFETIINSLLARDALLSQEIKTIELLLGAVRERVAAIEGAKKQP